MLVTAVKSGADAIYFGIDKLNMRAKAKNFTLEELSEVVKYCHENNVDAHLTVNSIVYENEFDELREIVETGKAAGVDLFIAWDLGAIQLLKEYGVPFCVSTQASIANSASAQFYKDLGAERIVLARECTLEQIKAIKKKVDIEIETFVHGAMCVAVSGRCFMSHHAFGQSANRGECVQNCRREYEIYDKRGDVSFLIGEDYVMSPKDLNTIEFIDLLIEAGIDSFKIEGRKRSPEYIATVISVYRRAIDLYSEGKLTPEIKKEMFVELETVYNRGFSSGFYFGTPSGEDYSAGSGNQATTKKVYVGKILNYFKKSKIAHALLQAERLETDEKIYIIGNSTGTVEVSVASLMKDETFVNRADKGDEVTFACQETVRLNDRIYKIIATDSAGQPNDALASSNVS
ncbi:MAG: U32 family peptidase [Chlorobi bacterium]|nr:U32 family peptidase [Chlorobiota bacterium]